MLTVSTPSVVRLYIVISNIDILNLYMNLTMGLKRGAFIVIEGVDRTGKTTQAKKLGKYH